MKEINSCVGSLNPTKINATKAAFSNYFENFRVYSIKVDSKVPDQPIGLQTIVDGAKNRAKSALYHLKNKGFDKIFGVGIEAGLAKIPLTNTGYMDFQFCVIMDEKERITIGSGIGFEYPPLVIKEVMKGKSEIGEIIGRLANNKNLKNEAGAISFLSKKCINRTEILTQAVICALLPRINKDLYEKQSYEI